MYPRLIELKEVHVHRVRRQGHYRYLYRSAYFSESITLPPMIDVVAGRRRVLIDVETLRVRNSIFGSLLKGITGAIEVTVPSAYIIQLPVQVLNDAPLPRPDYATRFMINGVDLTQFVNCPSYAINDTWFTLSNKAIQVSGWIEVGGESVSFNENNVVFGTGSYLTPSGGIIKYYTMMIKDTPYELVDGEFKTLAGLIKAYLKGRLDGPLTLRLRYTVGMPEPLTPLLHCSLAKRRKKNPKRASRMLRALLNKAIASGIQLKSPIRLVGAKQL